MATAALGPDPVNLPARAGLAFPPSSCFPLLPGIRSRLVTTRRLTHHLYESGLADGEPLVLIHGNVASGRFFEDLMCALPEYHTIAPDLRGFGASEARPVDATRGVRDYADDLRELVAALGLGRVHLLGWSLGGNIAMQYCMDAPGRVRSLTLLASGSPFGYGGTSGVEGDANHADFAGSGAHHRARRSRRAPGALFATVRHRAAI